MRVGRIPSNRRGEAERVAGTRLSRVRISRSRVLAAGRMRHAAVRAFFRHSRGRVVRVRSPAKMQWNKAVRDEEVLGCGLQKTYPRIVG